MNIDYFKTYVEKYGVARTNRYAVFIPVATLMTQATAAAQASGWNTSYFDDLCPDLDPAEMANRFFLFTKKAELPGMSYNFEDMRFYGESFKLPYQPVYSDVTLNFLCGGDMMERHFFDAWMYSVMDPQSHDFNYLTDYAVDISIGQYNEVAYSPGGGGIPAPPNSALANIINAANKAITYAGAIPGLGNTINSGISVAGAFASLAQLAVQNVGGVSQPGDFSEHITYKVKLYDAWPVHVNQLDVSYDSDNQVHELAVTFAYRRYLPAELHWNGTTGVAARGQSETFNQGISFSGNGTGG